MNDSYDTLHCVGRYACNREIEMALIRSLYRLLHGLRLGGCSTHSCYHTIFSKAIQMIDRLPNYTTTMHNAQVMSPP